MMALNSFGPKLVEMLGTEHFIATYLTAAVFSSWTSYVYKVYVVNMPNFCMIYSFIFF